MDGLTASRESRLAQGLGQGRMGMDGVMDIVHRRPQLHGESVLGDEFRSLPAQDMHAQDLAAGHLGDDLDEALGVAGGDRLADRHEREFAHLVGESAFLADLLGEADAGHLRLAIGATGE